VEPLLACEDEDEARGLATVLERAGILVELNDRGGRSAIDIAPKDAERARALLARIAGVHARRLDRDRDAHRSARERWFSRAAWISGAIAALIWLAIAGT
jgi:hypothetical protein